MKQDDELGSAVTCLSILWGCWPIPDTAVGQDSCQRVAEQDLSLCTGSVLGIAESAVQVQA